MTTTAATDEFEAHRSRLFGLAYRLPGSAEDAEDAATDTYLRFSGADPTVIEQPGAWLAKVVTHLCLTPTERAVYVLREALAYGYREIAAVLDLTEADCRQLYRRAAGRGAVRFVGGLDSPWPRSTVAPRWSPGSGTCSWAPRPSRSGAVS
ncbi:sigma factor-like helix-turn-helix DNA-binding protein [Streptomyces europaeiscabiei]|uniref:sigma factor-like helix-turn-helix DNA-binding protein n=1 Tax=Streptomyces europaeiscabiei TaxID=146819 RepID=UPI002E290C5B|nr:sigma factor-like helix-turn-helix DNA-binding protein [Streptomyces europaeiscabiei]